MFGFDDILGALGVGSNVLGTAGNLYGLATGGDSSPQTLPFDFLSTAGSVASIADRQKMLDLQAAGILPGSAANPYKMSTVLQQPSGQDTSATDPSQFQPEDSSGSTSGKGTAASGQYGPVGGSLSSALSAGKAASFAGNIGAGLLGAGELAGVLGLAGMVPGTVTLASKVAGLLGAPQGYDPSLSVASPESVQTSYDIGGNIAGAKAQADRDAAISSIASAIGMEGQQMGAFGLSPATAGRSPLGGWAMGFAPQAVVSNPDLGPGWGAPTPGVSNIGTSTTPSTQSQRDLGFSIDNAQLAGYSPGSDSGADGPGGPGSGDSGGGIGASGGDALGGVHRAEDGPRKTRFGEAGPETNISIPDYMLKPGPAPNKLPILLALSALLKQMGGR